MTIRFKTFVITFILLFSIVPYVFAQGISIEVELTSKKITLGSSSQLTITVNGSNDVGRIQLPKIDGFDVQYVGPSTRVSIINGQYSSSKAFTYSLFPLKEGQFEIPTFNIVVSGKTYQVEPIPIEVVGSSEGLTPVSQAQVRLEDKIFLVLEAPKREVYLNERLAIKVLLFVSGFSVNDVQYPEFDHVGFSIGEYEKPKQYQQIVSGIRYNVVEFSTEIYPTRTGELSFGPARTGCNILVERSNGSARSRGRNSIFDDDFFNSFFSRHEKRPIKLESEGAMINVLPFPEQGKPEDFSGVVGQFDFNVSVSPTKIKEGDPITFRMTVLGKGNLTAIQMPSLSPEANFKLYDPQVFEKGNIKKTEQVIIP
ncbi:MAG: protein BatD, partial [Candidatus Omnitrophica bacterium]|nr:protein BatD [Candidatus Omnitrophota bacterium]